HDVALEASVRAEPCGVHERRRELAVRMARLPERELDPLDGSLKEDVVRPVRPSALLEVGGQLGAAAGELAGLARGIGREEHREAQVVTYQVEHKMRLGTV